MNKSDPSQSRLKDLIHYDPKTGIFTHRKARGGRLVGSRADHRLICNNQAYRRICIDGQSYSAHRAAFVYMNGAAPQFPFEVDHKDRNGENNKWKNLRAVTRKVNILNRKISGQSGEKYVTPAGKKWRLRIQRVDHGLFNTKEKAVVARNKAVYSTKFA